MKRRTLPATRLACLLVFSLKTNKRIKDTPSSSGISNSILKQVLVFPTKNSLTFSDALSQLSILASQPFSLCHSLASNFPFYLSALILLPSPIFSSYLYLHESNTHPYCASNQVSFVKVPYLKQKVIISHYPTTSTVPKHSSQPLPSISAPQCPFTTVITIHHRAHHRTTSAPSAPINQGG